MRGEIIERIVAEFGPPSRERVKVKSWDLPNDIGVVVQMDQPTKDDAPALVWLPYPADGQPVPEIALEYPGEAGRHSGTYPVSGLKRGSPALRLTISDPQQLNDLIAYIRAMTLRTDLPEISGKAETERHIQETTYLTTARTVSETFVDPATMPKPAPVKPRREAIPRIVQREVWQRDGGMCVECSTRERLCFDHIVPFSKGGSNSVRNLQLLCESCNLSKSNRL